MDKRTCDSCGKIYKVDMRNFNRGWGRCCSKKCAAYHRERKKQNILDSKFYRKVQKKKKQEEARLAECANYHLGAVENLGFKPDRI